MIELQVLKVESINAHVCWVAINKTLSDDVCQAKIMSRFKNKRTFKTAKSNAFVSLN